MRRANAVQPSRLWVSIPSTPTTPKPRQVVYDSCYTDTHLIPAQNWKQCMHCGISAPHLATSPNISKTTCLNDICVAWATSSTDGESARSAHGRNSILWKSRIAIVVPRFLGGESSAPPQNISSTSEQRNVAAQTRLKRFAPSAITINTALLKPRSTSGSSFLEKTVTVAYTVSSVPPHLNDKLANTLFRRFVAVIPKPPTRHLVDRRFRRRDQC